MNITKGEKLMACFIKNNKRNIIGKLQVTKGAIPSEELQAYFAAIFLTWI